MHATLPDDPPPANDFPARAPAAAPISCPPRTGGVALGADEEAAHRYALSLPLSPDAAAERDAAWDRYDAWQAAVSRWLDGRGPHPDTL